MKLIVLPNAGFTHVAYLDPLRLVTVDDAGGSRTFRTWPLDADADDAPPGPLHWTRVVAVWELFKPNGAAFLSRAGLWPDGAGLSSASQTGSEWLHPALRLPTRWQRLASTPDGAGGLFAETVVRDGAYTTRFYLEPPPDDVRPLFHSRVALSPRGCFSPDGRWVAVSGGDKQAVVCDVAARREAFTFHPSDKVTAMTFAASDRLAVSAGRTVRLYRVGEVRPVREWPAFGKFVDTLALSPDGRLLAGGSRYGTVRVWDAASGDEVARYDWGVGAVNQVAFSPDGVTAAAAAEKGLVVWDVG